MHALHSTGGESKILPSVSSVSTLNMPSKWLQCIFVYSLNHLWSRNGLSVQLLLCVMSSWNYSHQCISCSSAGQRLFRNTSLTCTLHQHCVSIYRRSLAHQALHHREPTIVVHFDARLMLLNGRFWFDFLTDLGLDQNKPGLFHLVWLILNQINWQ